MYTAKSMPSFSMGRHVTTEDADTREAREIKAILRALREQNVVERLHADERIRRYCFYLQTGK
jgi:hypothetical protein